MSRAVPTFEIVLAALADEKLWFDLRTDEPRVKRYIHREGERFERVSTTDGGLDDVLSVEPQCARDMIDRALVRVPTRGGWREERANPAVLARLVEVRRKAAAVLVCIATGVLAFRAWGAPGGSGQVWVVASGTSLVLDLEGDRVRRLSVASSCFSPQERMTRLILDNPRGSVEAISPALRAEIDAKSAVARYPALLRDGAVTVRFQGNPDDPGPELLWRDGAFLLKNYGCEEILSDERLAEVLAERHRYSCEFPVPRVSTMANDPDAPPPPPAAAPPRQAPKENPNDPIVRMAALSKARGYTGAGAELDAREGERRMAALPPEARRVFELICCMNDWQRIQWGLAAIDFVGPLRDLDGALATLVESGLIAGSGMALNEALAEKVRAERPELTQAVGRWLESLLH